MAYLMAMYFARFVLFCADAVNDFMFKNCPYVAGAIAFYTMFSIFPLFLAVISVLGFVLGPEAERVELAGDIARVLPPISTEFIENTLAAIVDSRTITGIAGFGGVLWASTAAFGAIRKGINYAWGIRRTRPFLRERFMDVSLVVGAAVLVVVMLFITPVLSVLREATGEVAPNSFIQNEFFWDLATNLISPVISFVVFSMLYYFIPNTKVRFQDVWPVALGVAITFWGVNWGFVWYLRTYPVYSDVFGPVGAILAFMTWVYISAIIMLFGALLCSRYARYVALYGQTQESDRAGLGLILSSVSRVRLRIVRDSSISISV